MRISKKLIPIILIIFLSSYFSYGQNLKSAKENFNNKQYDLALKYFKKAWEKDKTNTELNYTYADCILKSNSDRTKAINLLEFVIGVDVNYKQVNLLLAKAYCYNNKYAKAESVLNFFKTNYKNDDSLIFTQSINEAILLSEHIKSAQKLTKKPLNVSFVNLGKQINTKRSEFNPFISENGRTLYFTSNKTYDSDLQELIRNIYYSNFSDTWGKLKSIGKNINTSENESITSLSKDENTIITHVTFMGEPGDLLISEKDKKRYGKLSEFNNSINSKFDEQSGDLSKNGDTLFFCSNRPGGYGGLDIYFSVKLPDNSWGNPQNIGSRINTAYDETYPQINKSGNILNFASNRPESMGGFDIFSSHLINSEWAEATNFGYPINNAYDNYTISYSRSMRYAYTAQVRPEGMGGLDIYQIIFNNIPPQIIIYSGTIKKRVDNKAEIIKEDISIKAYYSKTKKIFAESQYSSGGKYTFAFPPGEYYIIIEGGSISTKRTSVSIPENEANELFITKNITLK